MHRYKKHWILWSENLYRRGQDFALIKLLLLLLLLLGSKSCPSTMDIIGLRVPTRNLRDFLLFQISSSYKKCPSGRCATAANSICNQLDVFRRQIVTLSQMWYYFITLFQGVIINYLSIFYLFFVCLCVLVVFVSFVSCSLSVVICVCMLCCFCNWPSGCWLGTLIN
jgi:hypothetical protein